MQRLGRLLLTLVVAATLLIVAGCWDGQEIEHRTMILALGFDQEESGEFQVYIMMSSPTKSSQGGGTMGGSDGGGIKTHSLIATGRSPWEAFTALDARTARTLWTGQTQAIIISARLARRNIEPVIDMLKHLAEINRKARFVVTEDDLHAFFSMKENQTQDPSDYIQSAYARTGIGIRETTSVELWDIYTRLSNPQSFAMLPWMKVGTDELVLRGLGLFSGSRLTGTLQAAGTQAYLFAVGKGDKALLVVELPNAVDGGPVQATVELAPEKRELTLLGDAKNPRASIKLSVKADIANLSSLLFMFTQEYVPALEDQIEKAFAVQLQDALKTTREAGSDVWSFGEQYRAKHYASWTTQEDWIKTFREMPVEIEVKAHLGDMGPAQ